MKDYIKKLSDKIEEFKQQKTGLADSTAKTIVDAKINSLKWAIIQANGLERSSDKCNIQNVSGSFSDSDVKWVLYYGHTKDKRIFLDEEKSGLDYYLEDSFRRNETMKIFGEIFWNRIRKLVENYR
jgi:predicted secreted protein